MLAELTLPLILVLLGLVMIALEVYVPSAGVMGFMSALLMGAGIYLAFRTGNERGATWVGWAFLLGVMFLVPVILTVAVRTLPHTRLGKRFILDGAPKTEEARLASPSVSRLLHAHGTALTDLRPFGTAEIAGERHEVSTDGSFVPRGTPLQVHRTEGNRLYVRPRAADATDAASSGTPDLATGTPPHSPAGGEALR